MTITAWLLPTFLAFTAWSVSSFLPKMAVRTLPPLHVVVYEYFFFFVAVLVLLACGGWHLKFDPAGAALGMAIGIAGTAGQVFFVRALSKGMFSHVNVVTALYPLVTTVLAVTFLHETLALRQVAGILLGTAAIVLMVKSHDK